MYKFKPASPTYAISDTLVEHHLRGRHRTHAGGVRSGALWLCHFPWTSFQDEFGIKMSSGVTCRASA
jgi:hypothetical protein